MQRHRQYGIDILRQRIRRRTQELSKRRRIEQSALELERLDIQEEMAIVVSEDTSLNDPEYSASQRLPFQLAEPTFPPHHAAGNIATPNFGFPHQHNQQHNQPTFSFQTDRDIVNSMLPLSNDSAHMQGAEGSHVTAVQSSVSSYHNSLENAIMQIAEISKNYLPKNVVQDIIKQTLGEELIMTQYSFRILFPTFKQFMKSFSTVGNTQNSPLLLRN